MPCVMPLFCSLYISLSCILSTWWDLFEEFWLCMFNSYSVMHDCPLCDNVDLLIVTKEAKKTERGRPEQRWKMLFKSTKPSFNQCQVSATVFSWFPLIFLSFNDSLTVHSSWHGDLTFFTSLFLFWNWCLHINHNKSSYSAFLSQFLIFYLVYKKVADWVNFHTFTMGSFVVS